MECDLRTAIDLPSVHGRCGHSLRTARCLDVPRGIPESQVVTDAAHIGLFILPVNWFASEYNRQIHQIPHKRGYCRRCQTEFVVIWDRYSRSFDWDKLVGGRYRECLFISHKPSLLEEFEEYDAYHRQRLQAIAESKAVAAASAAARDSMIPRDPALYEASLIVSSSRLPSSGVEFVLLD